MRQRGHSRGGGGHWLLRQCCLGRLLLANGRSGSQAVSMPPAPPSGRIVLPALAFGVSDTLGKTKKPKRSASASPGQRPVHGSRRGSCGSNPSQPKAWPPQCGHRSTSHPSACLLPIGTPQSGQLSRCIIPSLWLFVPRRNPPASAFARAGSSDRVDNGHPISLSSERHAHSLATECSFYWPLWLRDVQPLCFALLA